MVISTGYLGKMISDYFRDGSDWGIKIAYAASQHPLGTAGQLKSAESLVKGRFVCLYGDALLDFDLASAMAFHQKKRAEATMVLMKHTTQLKYGFVTTDKDGRLTTWREKPKFSGDINIGCFVMEKSFLRYIPAAKMYGMKETFENAMAADAGIFGFKVKGEFIDIGDRASYKSANDLFLKRLGKVV